MNADILIQLLMPIVYSLGHCFFIEDSDETHNRLYFNLAMTANVLDNLLVSDNRYA